MTILNNDENNDKEVEREKGAEVRLPSLETAKARIALARQRYRVIVERHSLAEEVEPEKVQL